MKRNSVLILSFLLLSIGYSQNIELSGEVIGKEGLEHIHVINKSQQLYTTTKEKGTFKIEVKTGDTVVFSAVQYQLKTIIISAENTKNKTLKVILEEHINELPEALIGFTLTGDLTKDVLNSNAKPTINFYDVGIPGYKGKPKTKSERQLQTAGDFKPIMLLGLLAGAMPFDPLLNAISGRTKKLKKQVKLEAKDVLMYALKGRLSETFFKNNPLNEELKMDFFYFCTEDENFIKHCQQSDLEALVFMKEKYEAYKNNVKPQE